MFLHYWTDWKSTEDSVALSNMEIFNPDSVKSEFSAPFIEIDNLEVYKQRSDSTIHTKVEISYQHIDSLNNIHILKLSRFSLLQGPNDTEIFSQFVPPLVEGFGSDKSPKYLEYIYYLPGKITNHNADQQDKNKLTWIIKGEELGTGKYLTATYMPFRLKETPKWVYYSAILVFLIVLYFLFRRDK